METYLIPSLEEVIAEGYHSMFYEFAISRIVKSRSVQLVALPITGLKWFEIDTPEDLQHAERLFAEQELGIDRRCINCPGEPVHGSCRLSEGYDGQTDYAI